MEAAAILARCGDDDVEAELAQQAPWPEVPRRVRPLVAAGLVVAAYVCLRRAIPLPLSRPDAGGQRQIQALAESPQGCSAAFGQCGGGPPDSGGPACCEPGCACAGTQWYRQCMPPKGKNTCIAEATVPTTSTTMPTTTTRVTMTPSAAAAPRPSPGSVTAAPQQLPGRVFPRAACSWDRENCIHTTCCNVPGRRCYQKDAYWAQCERSCVPGWDPQPWSCRELGGHLEAEPLPPGLATDPAATSALLFCFTVVMPSTRVDGGEVGLVRAQQAKRVGVFACDSHAVYHGASTPKDGPLRFVAITPKLFVEIWDEVRRDGRYLLHDWTVKVDVDTVFFPERLRQHIAKLAAPKDAALYLKNSDVKFGFLSALEVFSKAALGIYFQQRAVCHEHLRGHGEALYLMACLDSIGVNHMVDTTLLNDQYTLGYTWDVKDVSRCGHSWVVAFHPFKHAKNWMACHDRARFELLANRVV